MNSLLLISATMTAIAALAEPRVEVLGEQEGRTSTRTLHVFGGRELAVQVQLSGGADGAQLRGRLYQLAGGVAAPLAEEFPIVFAPADHFRFAIPSVAHVTLMELRFTAQAEAARQKAGAARLAVYPLDHAVQLQARFAAAFEKAGAKLWVASDSPQLKTVLRAAGMIFEEHETIQAASAIHLAQGDAETASRLVQAAPEDAKLLIFTTDPQLPTGVYWTDRPRGFIAKVTLPVLADFDRSPDRQALFYHLLHRALTPSPSP